MVETKNSSIFDISKYVTTKACYVRKLPCQDRIRDEIEALHNLGHFNFNTLLEGLKTKQIPYASEFLKKNTDALVGLTPDMFQCEHCDLAKMRNGEFKTRNRTYLHVGEVLNADHAIGLPLSREGNSSALVVVDHYSSYIWVLPLKSKDEGMLQITGIIAYVEQQTPEKVKAFISNRGGECLSIGLGKYLTSKGVRNEYSHAYLHQANGRAEVTIRTLFSLLRTHLSKSGVRVEFWDYCLRYVAILYNMGYAQKLKASGEIITPYRCILGDEPRTDHVHTFGHSAIGFVNQEERGRYNNVEVRGSKGLYLGPDKLLNAANFWLVDENRIKISTTYKIFDDFDVAKSMSDKGYSLLLDPACSILTPENYGEKEFGKVVHPSPTVGNQRINFGGLPSDNKTVADLRSVGLRKTTSPQSNNSRLPSNPIKKIQHPQVAQDEIPQAMVGSDKIENIGDHANSVSTQEKPGSTSSSVSAQEEPTRAPDSVLAQEEPVHVHKSFSDQEEEFRMLNEIEKEFKVTMKVIKETQLNAIKEPTSEDPEERIESAGASVEPGEIEAPDEFGKSKTSEKVKALYGIVGAT